MFFLFLKWFKVLFLIEKGNTKMTDKVLSNKETVKKAIQKLLTENSFEGYEDFSNSFKSLSIPEKIEMIEYIKMIPSSTRKTLLFSAFLKKEKKKISRDISLGFII